MLAQTDCFAYWQGRPWMRVGTPTPDGQGCENQGHIIPIGYELKQDRDHDSFYCYDESGRLQNQTGKKWCLERPDKPQSTGDYLMRRWAGGIDNSVAALKKGDDKVRQGIGEMAAGTPLHATTPVREAEVVGQKILSTARNATRDDAKHAAQGVLDAAAAWLKKPWQQKLGDTVESVGNAMASPTTYIPAAGILRKGEIAVDAIEDAAKAGKTGRRVSKAAAERKTSPTTTLPSRYGHLSDHPSVDAGKDYTRAQKRKIFEENMRRGGGSLKSDASGDVLVSPRKHERGVTPPSNEAHVDHVQPKAHGGTNSFQNAQVLSRDENLKKGTK